MNDTATIARDADPVARARALAPALTAASDEIERTRRFPETLLAALHDARLFRLLLPRHAGGDEVEPWIYLAAVEQIARHEGSVAWNIFVGNSSALLAAYLPADSARAIYADPRAVVAWGPPNACRLRAAPGGYRVTGRWDFASGCRQATWMGAHALVVESDGSLRLNAAGRPTVRSVLFPVEQATLLDTWHTIGLRGTASDSYTVDDVFVPEAFSATREDPTLRREPGRLYAFTQAGLYAVGVAAVASGLAGAMLDAFVALARDKSPRGIGRLGDNAVVQANVARMTARLDSARAYLIDTLTSIWAGAGSDAPIDVPDRARVRLACEHAIHSAEAVADFAYKAAGVDAIFLGTPFERRFRDMHTLSQQIQARTAHYESVGQVMFGLEPVGGFL
jgi:alkylation response protein AidB-like acyl-CoA dehydrogenase